MNTELRDAIEALEKEKNIMRETLFEAIENALLTACKNNFGKVDNIKVWVDRDTFEYFCVAEKEVVETKDDVEDELLQIPLEDAVKINPALQVGDKVDVKINSQSFGRIATQIAKNVILQRIREEERSAIYDYYFSKQKSIVTGIVQRINGGSISVNLGRAEGLLNEKETVPGENLKPQDRIKVYVIDVRKTQRGPRILVSRTHPELVKKLFEQEVTEIQEGVVEIKSIAREPGSRTKIAVYSNDPRVDAVGACVGVNGIRVNNIVEELRGEKIDIINWDENPGNLIQNALSPAKIVAVFADPEEKTAKVVVPDYQLSLAIGREGQNARLAAKLTSYKIDIKSETQAKDAPGFRYEDYEDDEYYEDEYDEEFADEAEYEEETGEGADAEDAAEGTEE
ncbi:MAG: transcription termination/antitermination protein NusA [Lachnospiraceae bacterium]|nr:transcription termination/antitermination protein NusA [Lachnospiraceae bacterium]